MDNLEQRLLEEKLVQQWQIDSARLEATHSGKSLWAVLVKLGYLSEEDITMFFAGECGIPYVRLSDYTIDPAVLRLLEENFCIQNLVIPLFRIGNTLFVACSNPLNTALMDDVAKMSGCVIEPLIAPAHAIVGVLDLYWRFDERIFELGKYILRQSPVQGVGFWRESERLPLGIPVSLTLFDGKEVSLLRKKPVNGLSFDISADATAAGIEIPVYLPKGISVLAGFLTRNPDSSMRIIQAKGEILRISMSRNKQYLVGIKFSSIDEESRKLLIALAAMK